MRLPCANLPAITLKETQTDIQIRGGAPQEMTLFKVSLPSIRTGFSCRWRVLFKFYQILVKFHRNLLQANPLKEHRFRRPETGNKYVNEELHLSSGSNECIIP